MEDSVTKPRSPYQLPDLVGNLPLLALLRLALNLFIFAFFPSTYSSGSAIGSHLSESGAVMTTATSVSQTLIVCKV